MMWNNDQYYFGWPGMVFFLVVFWALAGAAVFILGRWLGRDRPGTDALAILDERLARGEIDVEQYARLWQVIETHRPIAPRR